MVSHLVPLAIVTTPLALFFVMLGQLRNCAAQSNCFELPTHARVSAKSVGITTTSTTLRPAMPISSATTSSLDMTFFYFSELDADSWGFAVSATRVVEGTSYLPVSRACMIMVSRLTNAGLSFSALQQLQGGVNYYYSISDEVPANCACPPGFRRVRGHSRVFTAGTTNGGIVTVPPTFTMTTTPFKNEGCVVCLYPASSAGGSILSDPVMEGFDGTRLYIHGEFGVPYALMTFPGILVSGVLGSMSPANASLGHLNDEWLVALGIRVGTHSLSVRLAASIDDVETFADEQGVIRSRVVAPAFNNPLELIINGELAHDLLFSGHTLNQSDCVIFFPDWKTTNNASNFELVDGPIVVVDTELMQVTIYLESEGAMHLDMQVRLHQSIHPADAHGLLGQTVAWMLDDEVKGPHTHTIEGNMADYRLDAMFAPMFTFSTFDTHSSQKGRAFQAHGDSRLVGMGAVART